jgi:hypothetical protein
MRSPPCSHRTTRFRLAPDKNTTHFFSEDSSVVGRAQSRPKGRLGKVGTGAGPLAPAVPLRLYSAECVEKDNSPKSVYSSLHKGGAQPVE